MGRPLNSRNFGPGAGKIVITFHDGDNVVDGYIVKQTGTRRYQVTADGVNIKEVTLAETVEQAENLVEGSATIAVQDGEGNVSYVTTLQSVTARTASGETVTWSDDPESDSAMTIVTRPVVGAYMNSILNAAAFAEPATRRMYMGTGNYGVNYQIARDEDQGLEIGLKVHKRNVNTDYKAESIEGGLAIAVPENTSTGDLDWVVAFSLLAGLNGANTKLADYDFKISLNLDPTAEGEPVDMLHQGDGSWTISGTEIMELDPGLASKGADITKVEQNIFNLGWASLDAFRPEGISADWRTELGSFNITLTAQQDGEDVLSVAIVVNQAGDEPAPPQEPEPDVGGDEEPPVDDGV